MLIAHAGGMVYDSKGNCHFYTNSKQALQHAFANGYKYIELDLTLDADGDIFAAHDYKHLYETTGKDADFVAANLDTPPTKAYLAQAKIVGEFDILTYEDINAFFAEHTDLVLVTDKIEDFDKIRQQLTFDSERIWVEVFSTASYMAAQAAGLKYPMLNVYSNEGIIRAQELGITMLTMGTAMLQADDLSVIEAFIEDGGVIATYTSNDISFMRQHLGTTSTLFYNDHFDFKTQSCAIDGTTY